MEYENGNENENERKGEGILKREAARMWRSFIIN